MIVYSPFILLPVVPLLLATCSIAGSDGGGTRPASVPYSQSAAARAELPGKELRLTYTSSIDQTVQPYRLYVPASYDARRPVPLVIALHGTSGDEGTLFEKYGQSPQRAAERFGVLVLCPFGRGKTEYRGIGEVDLFCVLDEVRKRYVIDEDRIYVTGHSMGGTGSVYMILHHPDLFAAAAPLAAAYSYPWLARNAYRTPMLWIAGAEDAEYYHRGGAVGLERMRKFGAPVKLEVLPGGDHAAPAKDFERVFAWLLQYKRDPHPTEYFFEVDTPLHGRSYWTDVEALSKAGQIASVQGKSAGKNRAEFTVNNVAGFSFSPDPQVFDQTHPIAVSVNNTEVFDRLIPSGQELFLSGSSAPWKAKLRPKREHSWTEYRSHPVAVAPTTLDMHGTEKLLANWITDAMRYVTGADVALWGGFAYRGLPILLGTVDLVDFIQCSRPFDQYLVTVGLTGVDIREILDANVDLSIEYKLRPGLPGASLLVQLSGAHYTFDPARPAGQRIIECDLQPDRVYKVALEGQVVERETMRLAGRFKKLDYQSTSINLSRALYAYAVRTGRVEARREGRVRQVQQPISSR